MNIRKIINEIITENLQIENIQKECSDFIDDGNLLYHGTLKDFLDDVTKIQYYKDVKRLPRDIAHYIDNWLEELRLKYNPDAVSRQKAIFVTTDIDQAESYGQIYYFIPCNGYKVSSNKKIQDLFSDVCEDLQQNIYGMQHIKFGVYKINDTSVSFDDYKKQILFIKNRLDNSNPAKKQLDEIYNSLQNLENYWKNTDNFINASVENLIQPINGFYLVKVTAKQIMRDIGIF